MATMLWYLCVLFHSYLSIAATYCLQKKVITNENFQIDRQEKTLLYKNILSVNHVRQLSSRQTLLKQYRQTHNVKDRQTDAFITIYCHLWVRGPYRQTDRHLYNIILSPMSEGASVPGHIVAPARCLDPVDTPGVDVDHLARPLHESGNINY